MQVELLGVDLGHVGRHQVRAPAPALKKHMAFNKVQTDVGRHQVRAPALALKTR